MSVEEDAGQKRELDYGGKRASLIYFGRRGLQPEIHVYVTAETSDWNRS